MKLEIPGIPRPYVMGHRGNLVACPENTMASFRQAIADGADIMETDIHVTADGIVIIIHDPTLDRTTDGTGPVREKTLEEIKQVSASYGRAEFAEETVPTLAEFLAIVPEGMVVALELKTDDFLETRHADTLINELEAAGMAGRAVLLSFADERVRFVAARAKERGIFIPAGFITYKRLLPKPGVELNGPVWPLLVINPLYVWLSHRRGQPVAPLDPTPDSRLWYYKLLGCDAVLSNDPGATLRKLGR